MKKIFTLLAVAIMAIVNANAQTISSPTGWVDTPENWEDYVVDIFIWGSGNSHLTPEDTIPIGNLVDGEYNGYLPVVIECPDVAEVVDIGTKETVGFSKHIKINDVAQLRAFEMNSNHTVQYGTIIVYKAYTRPPQMIPFTDTLFIEEGKKEILKPWHWVPYEETYINPLSWTKDGENINEYFGMKRIEISGPAAGDTVIYTVNLRDSNACVTITNTFIVVGTEKSHYGVDEAVASQINIYPNPSNDGVITIKGEGTAEIFNIIGQKVMDVEVMNETKVSLSSGLYIVRLGGRSEKVFVE